MRFGFFLVTFLALVTCCLSGEEESSSDAMSRLRLRRPGKRNPARSTTTTTSTTTSVPPTATRGKTPPPRSRFRLKTTTGKPTTPTPPTVAPLDVEMADQEPAGSIASTRIVPSRLKPKTKTSTIVGQQTGGKDYKIVCYYTNWSQYRPKIGKFLPEDIPADLCTHVIFAFGWMKKGKLSSFETQDETKDGKPGFYERVNNLKKVNPQLKTLLAIGGWSFGTAKFKEMAATRYTRQTFIFSAIPYLRERDFDGLDMDWEYPKGADDKKNFILLLKELREAFEAEEEETGKPRLLLTAAVPVGPESIRGGYDVPAVNNHLDFINLMAYDFHGKWESQTGHNAPLYAPSSDSEWRKQLSVENAAKTWVKLGAEKEKLVIGMPTYGRSFQLSNPSNHSVNVATKGGGTAGIYTKEGGFLAYYEICEILSSGGALYIWDSEMKVPYLVSDDQWVGFDDERAIRNKMNWIKKEGFGGAMVWSIDMDDFTGTACPGKVKYPLIGAMREELHGVKRSGTDVDWSQVASTPEEEEPTSKESPEVIDPKELIAAAKKRKNQAPKLIIAPDESKTRPPAITCFVSSESSDRKGKGKFTIENIDPTKCTQIVFSSAILKGNKLSPSKEGDLDPETGSYARLLKLKTLNPEVKILLSLGGEVTGSKSFQTLTSNVYRMNNFVYAATEFLREHSFDGLDVDWQFPKGKIEKEGHVNLIKELRLSFEGETKTSKLSRLLLTITVPPREEAIFEGYDVSELGKYVDYFNIMTFDLHGQWDSLIGHNAPLHPIESATPEMKKLSVSHAANVWVTEGAPPEKVLIGIPTYARTFTLESEDKFDIGAGAKGGGTPGRWTKETGFMAYYEVCEFLQLSNTTLVWDNEQSVPFAYNGDQWIGFDDERSVKAKTDWLRSESFGGVMVWSVDLDDFGNSCGTGKYPLLTSVQDGLADYKVKLEYKGPYEGSLSGGSKNKKDANEVTCEEEDGHISYHPDKVDCSKYYMCEGERKHHMPCPANLVFNPDQNVCDWLENVESCKELAAKTNS